MPSLQFDPLIYAHRHALSPGPSPVVPPISRLAHRLLHASNTVFKKRAPPSDFWPLLLIFGPPAATSWRRVWLSPVHFLYHVLRSFVFFFIMSIRSPTVVSQHLSKSDKRGWLTRWPPRSFTNPIWHSARLCLRWSAVVPLCFHLL